MIKLNALTAAVLLTLSAGAFAATPVANGSFETSNVLPGDYNYAAAISGHSAVVASSWTFSGGSGVATDNSIWGGTAFAGSSYAFLQGAGGVISQTFSAGAGAYTIDFALAQRTSYGAVGAQSIQVTLDGNLLSLNGQVLNKIKPPTYGDTDEYGGWTSYSFNVNSVAAGSHTLSFAGMGSGTHDTTVFLDKVAVTAPVPEPETYAMLLAGLGLMGAIARRRKAKQA